MRLLLLNSTFIALFVAAVYASPVRQTNDVTALHDHKSKSLIRRQTDIVDLAYEGCMTDAVSAPVRFQGKNGRRLIFTFVCTSLCNKYQHTRRTHRKHPKAKRKMPGPFEISINCVTIVASRGLAANRHQTSDGSSSVGVEVSTFGWKRLTGHHEAQFGIAVVINNSSSSSSNPVVATIATPAKTISRA